MICEVCQKNLATVHVTQVAKGVMERYEFCDGCAALKGIGEPLLGLTDPGLGDDDKPDLEKAAREIAADLSSEPDAEVLVEFMREEATHRAMSALWTPRGPGCIPTKQAIVDLLMECQVGNRSCRNAADLLLALMNSIKVCAIEAVEEIPFSLVSDLGVGLKQAVLKRLNEI